MAKRLSSEIAEASRVLTNDLPAKFVSTRQTDVLVQTAKELERLQSRRRKLRKELRDTDSNIRLKKRELKALAQRIGEGE